MEAEIKSLQHQIFNSSYPFSYLPPDSESDKLAGTGLLLEQFSNIDPNLSLGPFNWNIQSETEPENSPCFSNYQAQNINHPCFPHYLDVPFGGSSSGPSFSLNSEDFSLGIPNFDGQTSFPASSFSNPSAFPPPTSPSATTATTDWQPAYNTPLHNHAISSSPLSQYSTSFSTTETDQDDGILELNVRSTNHAYPIPCESSILSDTTIGGRQQATRKLRKLKPKITKPPPKRSRSKLRGIAEDMEAKEYIDQPFQQRVSLPRAYHGMHHCTEKGCKRNELNHGFSRKDNLRVHLRNVHGIAIEKLVRKRRIIENRRIVTRAGRAESSSGSELCKSKDSLAVLNGPLLDGSSTLDLLAQDPPRDLDSQMSSKLPRTGFGDGLDTIGLWDLNGEPNLTTSRTSGGLQSGQGPDLMLSGPSPSGSGTSGDDPSSTGSTGVGLLDLEKGPKDSGNLTDWSGSSSRGISKPKGYLCVPATGRCRVAQSKRAGIQKNSPMKRSRPKPRTLPTI